MTNLAHQTVSPERLIVSVPDSRSLPAEAQLPSQWEVVTGSKGLALQRNAALDHLRPVDTLSGVDIVFFFDDDAMVRDDYVENALKYFRDNPDVVGLTGMVLLDGAVSGEIGRTVAADALVDSLTTPLTRDWRPTRELYGCNFAFRVSASPTLRFDGQLPLYSWLEDHDFARRLRPFGTLAKVDDCVIVHRASSSGGRQAHARLGYSQVMNPIHLWRKGSFPLWLAAWEIFRPSAKNIAKSVGGAERSWRRIRLRANLLAWSDALRGKITPERILTF